MKQVWILALAFLVAGLASVGPARAQRAYDAFTLPEALNESMSSATYKSCLEQTGGVTAYIMDCISGEYERLDGRLNRSYQATIRRLSRTRMMDLRSSQRAWLATRDEKCLGEVEGDLAAMGSLDRITLRFCALNELKRRIIWIERWR
jgi:uncharacterized protein YecT (DUF1311 family)